MKFLKILLPLIVVFALLGCGTTKTQSPASTNSQTQPSSSPAQTAASPIQMTNISFQWIGVDADKLSPNDLNPDSKLDGHFHITVPFSQPSLLKSIWIRYSEFGKSYKWGWVYNKNLPIAGYKMGVFDDTTQPILPQGDNGYRVDGLKDFDLFISELNNENQRDTLKFGKGQVFSLEVDYINQNNEEKEFDSSVTIDK
jgi:hypothetical protein